MITKTPEGSQATHHPSRRSAASTRMDQCHGTSPTVVNCYDFMDRVFPACGLTDLTDGMYHGDPAVSYQQSQRNQAEWLLEQVKCSANSRLLDIGCGYGRLLEAARKRGAKALGLTVSPRQVASCRQRGLDARLLDYRELDDSWDGAFDGIVANGSIEHFVHPRAAALGWQEIVYRQLFQDCHRLLDPASPSGRMAATVIHFNRVRPDPSDLLKHPFRFPIHSDRFHLALLERVMGGHYPRGRPTRSVRLTAL